MKAKTKKSLIRGGIAVKVWNMALDGIDYKTIGQAVGFTTDAICAYLKQKYKKAGA
jgi:hypothetical protein